MTVEIADSADGSVTLLCRGRIGMEASDVFKSEVKRLAPRHKQILVDMSGVNFVDSAGLGAVMASYISAKSVGCELKLVNVHPWVKDLLNRTRLNAVLEVR